MNISFRNNWRPFVFWTAILLIVLVAGYCIWMLYPNLQPGDKGTWAGAIGTFFTLVGTIVLATGESRKRHRTENALARLTCVSLYPRQLQVEETINIVLARLEQNETSPDASSDCSRSAALLAQLPLWAVEELMPIATLPLGAANGLATVAGNLRHVQMVLGSSAGHPDALRDGDRIQLVTLLKLTKQSLVGSMAVCKRTMAN